ncbi:MAG: hypothetical protein VB997_10205 [Opitutales bacterium]
MRKTKDSEELLEFKFEYQLNEDQSNGEKFYLAHNLREAVKDFRHTCRKRHLHPHHLHVSRWDRWNTEWNRLN